MYQEFFFNAELGSQSYDEKLLKRIKCEELRELVKAFGNEKLYSESETDIEILKQLVAFSSIWDYRQRRRIHQSEGERWQVDSGVFTETQKVCIENAIDALGLRGIQQPCQKKYDYIIALGGARMSCLYRTQYAYDIFKKEEIPKLVLLSSLRKVMDSERVSTDTYAPLAQTEFDLMNAALKKLSRICNVRKLEYEDENYNLSWKIVEGVDIGTGKEISSIAAPSRNKERRANSADTYDFFLEKEEKKKNKQILFVTSQIYVPYQHIEAVRMIGIPYKMNIDTVGYPLEWNGSTGKPLYENYLQEIRSTLQAIDRLVMMVKR